MSHVFQWGKLVDWHLGCKGELFREDDDGDGDDDAANEEKLLVELEALRNSEAMDR